MTSSHIFYIPLVLLAGIVLGIMLGRRSALVSMEEEARRAQRAEARRDRAAPPASPAATAADPDASPRPPTG